MCSVQCAVCSVRFAGFSVQCAVFSVQCSGPQVRLSWEAASQCDTTYSVYATMDNGQTTAEVSISSSKKLIIYHLYFVTRPGRLRFFQVAAKALLEYIALCDLGENLSRLLGKSWEGGQ